MTEGLPTGRPGLNLKPVDAGQSDRGKKEKKARVTCRLSETG